MLFSRSDKVFILIVSIACLLAHIESWLVANKTIYFHFLLTLDFSLIALIYYVLSFYLKKMIKSVSFKVTLFSLLVSLVIIILYSKKTLNFHYELKYIEYTNIILDFFVPILFTISVFDISQQLAKLNFVSKLLSYIGLSSLTIIYLHFPINLTLKHILNYGSLVIIICGLVIPLIISYLV